MCNYCNSVRPSTQKTYSTGEQRWFVVVEHIGTDPLMRIIPSSWVSPRRELYLIVARVVHVSFLSIVSGFWAGCHSANSILVYICCAQVPDVDVKFVFSTSRKIQNPEW